MLKTLYIIALFLLIMFPNNIFANEKKIYPILEKSSPESVGFSSEKLLEIDALINSEVKNGFPGAAIIIIKDGKIIKDTSYGYALKYDKKGNLLKNPTVMQKDTMFDLASNTKIYATGYAIQSLYYQGKLNINDKIQKYLPKFKSNKNDTIKGKDELTIADLMLHQGGFPADPQYHNQEQAKNLYSKNKKEILEAIYETPLVYAPKTKHIYSDVDYILLGIIIEEITKMPLDLYLEENIYKPLGLKNTLMNPLQKGFKKNNFAATELAGNTRDNHVYFKNIRTEVIQGEVHDEKAFYSLQGVAGHAGLFSNIYDMAVLLQVMLNGGTYGNKTLFDEKTIKVFLTPSKNNPTYALGWRKNGNSSMEWMFSPYASKNTFGHTGWVGTITVIDFENNLGIVFLSNKKHTKVLKTPTKQEVFTTGCDNETKLCYNKFEGDEFQISTYGALITKVYEAMNKQ